MIYDNHIGDLLKSVENAVHGMIEKSVLVNEQKLNDHENRLKALEDELKLIKLRIKSEQQTIFHLQKTLASKEFTDNNTKKIQLSNIINESINKYSARLGLIITKISPYSLQFLFQNITLNDTEHKIILFLDSSNIFCIRDCTPCLPNVDDLILALNSSQDISKFIISTRKSFKSLY
jgi:Chromosome segregation protein Spc25